MSVASQFETFSSNLIIGTDKRSTVSTRYLAICKRLNIDFWKVDVTSGGRYVGSYGRNTSTNWTSDFDILFEMPFSTYDRYNNYIGNGQSAFLQEVKRSIAKTYSSTELKGDGQIVQVSFSDGDKFEVLPVFKNSNGTYTYADSNSGGSWRITNPVAEIEAISAGDNQTNNNLRRLCRMARAWKRYCSVPIKGLLIDTLAHRFLMSYGYRDRSYLYYDFMSRDFFAYLRDQTDNQILWYAVGSLQNIYNVENFRPKAAIAYNRSLEAIQHQTNGNEWSSKQKWREIYGHRFPD